MMPHDEIADEVLADRVRQGDDDAYGILWQRHSAAGLAAARPLAALADPDDLVSEAYLAIFRALRSGGGPREAFRPYLYRTIRNIAYTRARTDRPVSLEVVGEIQDDSDLESTTVENTLTTRAFRSLPERWQTVLWYSEVEGMRPTEFGPLLGLAPNSAAALAHRAREGLRTAWLQAHVSEVSVPEECRWTVERMGEYARGGLTPRARTRFKRHLDGCARCPKLLDEVDEVSRQLALTLVPLVLGAGAAVLWLRDRPSPDMIAASGPTARGHESRSAPDGPSRPLVVGTALVAAAALIVAATSLVSLAREETASEPQTARPPSPTAPPSPPSTPAPAPDPSTSERPATEDDETPPASPPPGSTDTSAPGPVGLDAPGDTSLGNDPRPEFRGRGEPGALIEVVVVPASGPPAAATTTVLGDGSWALQTAALPDGVHRARVTQIDRAGNRSVPVAVSFEIDTVALPPVVDPLDPTHVALPVVTGIAEPGATVDLLVDGIPVASTITASGGAWAIEVPDPRAATAALETRQTDRAGNTSTFSPPVSLTFERPHVLAPSAGSSLPSTGGATVLTVEFDGVAGREVEILIDGVPTGNRHLLTGSPLSRVTPPLSDGGHVIAFRYVGGGRPGASVEVAFTIVP